MTLADGLRELYQEVILDHGKSPRNFRHPDDSTCEAKGDNPLCGDRLAVYAKVNGSGVIEDVAFEGRGCAISIASASMMTELLRGKSLDEAEHLFDGFHHLCTGEGEPGAAGGFEDEMAKLEVLSGVRRFPMRVKCATLAWHTFQAAVHGDKAATTE